MAGSSKITEQSTQQASQIDSMAGQAERLKWLDKAIAGKKYPSAVSVEQEFGIPLATAYRDIDYLKYILRAPMQYDYDKEGYTYSEKFKLRRPFGIDPFTSGDAMRIAGCFRQSILGCTAEHVMHGCF